MKAPSKDIVEWCRSKSESEQQTFRLQVYFRNKPSHQLEEFVDDINSALKVEARVAVNLDEMLPNDSDIHLHLERFSFDHEMTSLAIHGSGGNLILERLPIRSFHIDGNPRQSPITIRDCVIGHLDLRGCKSIKIENSHIGTLRVINANIPHFEMRGGSILNIECPPPWEESPFNGSVSLVDVFLPRDPKRYLISGPQPYRNLRAHLRSLENSQGAGLIHSAELAMERVTDSRTNKLLSHAYEWFSDFGSSALRPLLWLLGLWFVTFVVIWVVDGAALAFDNTEYTGWRHVLVCNDVSGQFWRALVLSLQQLASPLTILGAKPLLVPKYWWLAVWSVIHSLLSVVLLALGVLAVRRRFKMD